MTRPLTTPVDTPTTSPSPLDREEPTISPPALSEVLAATTIIAISSPRVSTIPKVLRPKMAFAAPQPLVAEVTAATPRTEQARANL